MQGRHQKRKPRPHVPREDIGVIHGRQDPIELRDRDILRRDTKVQGQYEKALKDVLLEMGSLMELCWYQPVTLDLGKGVYILGMCQHSSTQFPCSPALPTST